MAVRLNFFVNLNTGEMSKSDTSLVAFSLPDLVAGDSVLLAIGLVDDRTSAFPGTLDRQTSAGTSCQVAIGTEGAAPHTSATMSVVDNLFQAVLPLNVAGITGLFTSTPTQPVSRTFEMQFTDAGGELTIKKSVTIRNQLITGALVDAPAPDVALGKAEAANLYLKQGENAAGGGFVLVSPDGNQKAFCYLDDQGQFQVSPLT